jgi:adenylate kinase
MQRPAPRIILAGRPGAGKGTQGARLAQRLGVPYLSTGDLLRREIAAGSSLGRVVEDVVQSGELIPTALIIAIVESCLDGDGYVLDGFPRTVDQAVAVTSSSGLEPHMAIEIVVPAATALARLTERGRTDDDVDVARRRLVVYETETVPMLGYLNRLGLLRSVNGKDHPEVVAENIWRQAMLSTEAGDWQAGSVEPDLAYAYTDPAELFGAVAAG